MTSRSARRPAVLGVSALLLVGLAPQVAHADDYTSPDGRHATIVGGDQAQEGAWPMQAKVRMKTSEGTYGCGGTLISPDILLTAQHCLDKTPSSMTVTINVGKVDWKQGTEYKIKDWRTGAGPKRGDWAVAKLEQPVTGVTKFAQLPADSSQDAAREFTAIGWGKLSETGSSSQNLMQVDLPLHTGNQCSPYSSSEICASGNGTAGKDTCNGDSGGPLFVKGTTTQVGITSWGVGCARADQAGHYTKVSAFRTQILDAITALGGTQPGPAPAPTSTPAPVPTETSTPAPVPTETSTPAPVPTETSTPAPVPTETSTPAPTPTETSTTTPAPVPTETTAPAPSTNNAVKNGDFESAGTGWSATPGVINTNPGRKAHSGSGKLWLAGTGRMNWQRAQQTVKVPTGNPKLTYWVAIDTAETSKYARFDNARVAINGTPVASYSAQDKTNGYVQKTVDLTKYAGKTITLGFSASEDYTRQTSFVFDDITIG
ncbi:trypsin-like serine protease [Arsenicicoccus dermatophilus]|uniref:trypsin-like serine protease n=1 Tax=Arsenicicoccus dermatophilus TaxID=1076331 RepID=UPI001F4C5972|nr:trypsin-like serine protease [Arsenicicoccus dermatophilus]MCH8612033.1 trypsin-like serine protease [Arsenicicoccus dermatophilus]